MTLSGLGLVIGLAGGLGLASTVRHLLFGVQPFDPLVLAGSVGLCFAAAMTACLVPAWRASRVDPMRAVQAE